MKKEPLSTAILMGFGAFVSRRIYRAAYDTGTATVPNLIKNALVMSVAIPSNTAGFMEFVGKYSSIPEALQIFKKTEVNYDPALDEIYTLTGMDKVFLVNGVPVVYYGNERGLDKSLYFPRWAYEKLKPVIKEILRPRKTDVDHPSTFYFSSGNALAQFWKQPPGSGPIMTTLDSMPIHSELRPKLVAHADRMRKEWIDKKNLSYSRNILLYGPKGSGKTYLMGALASAMKSYMYQFPLVKSRKEFVEAVAAISPGSVVFADEIELISQFKKDAPSYGNEDMSTRCVLDYLSGMTSPPGVFTVCCTNDPDKLDDRITRKGRFKDTYCVAEVDDAGIKYWLAKNHDYVVPEGVSIKPMLCADIFDQMDTLDDPETFVKNNMIA